MSPREAEALLVEAALGAHRERDRDGLPLPAPSWADLTPEGRKEVFRRQLQSRVLERALDERGWSSTVRAVMARLA
jgi:hypothetical protein